MAVVVFSYSGWSLRYPELAAVTPLPLAQAYFTEACLYCDNSDASPISDPATRALLLNMATAHIAQLNRRNPDGSLASPLVGRISSATEGSVTVQATMDFPPGSAQWWQQTPYGAAWWAATSQYRKSMYVPSWQSQLGGFPYIGGFPRG